MSRIAIIAAMAGELKPLLVRGWRHESCHGVELWRKRSGENEWVAACAGAGVEAATRAFAEAEKSGAIDRVISVGWAGALTESMVPGRAYRVSEVIDLRTGERFNTSVPSNECRLVTSLTVVNAEEKRRLTMSYTASLVDMEAAAVAGLARMRGIPFDCIKGVSDGVNDHLPDFNRFISSDGQFRLSRMLVFALLRPWIWPALARMGENSKRAARSIAESVESLFDVLDESGQIRKYHGNSNHKD